MDTTQPPHRALKSCPDRVRNTLRLLVGHFAADRTVQWVPANGFRLEDRAKKVGDRCFVMGAGSPRPGLAVKPATP